MDLMMLLQSRRMSDAFRMEHDDELRVGDSVFMCHIHNGTDTCAKCEPGCVQSQQSAVSAAAIAAASRTASRSLQLGLLVFCLTFVLNYFRRI